MHPNALALTYYDAFVRRAYYVIVIILQLSTEVHITL